MDKILKLEPWKLYLLFLSPIALAFALSNIGIGEAPIRHMYSSKFYTTLGILCPFLVFTWLYFKGLSFFKESQFKTSAFKINGAIPIIFFGVIFLYSIYEFGLFLEKKDFYLNNKNAAGPLKPIDSGYLGIIFNIFFIHAIISLFLNNKLVENQLKKIENKNTQKEYFQSYLKPMRHTVKAFALGLALSFLFFVFYDILKLL